jgi:glycosyltransferase involved in cell wall biosynthesis
VTKVSVLLAVYNGEPYLGEAIESVRAQTHENWELIVVSNGSTDATEQIASRAAAADSRIRFFRLAEKGKNRAYNHAYQQATGSCFCFFAADDILTPDSLAERVAALGDATGPTYVSCCLKTTSADPKYDGLVFPKNMAQPNYSGGALLFTRTLAAKIFPLPDEQPNEDTWTMLHVRAFGELRHVPRSLYRYRIHGANSFGYGMKFEDKRQQYLRRMHAYQLFLDRYATEEVPFLDEHVRPFIRGLRAATLLRVPAILAVRGLGLRQKLVLVFYCSKFLYKIRYTYFRALSGAFSK